MLSPGPPYCMLAVSAVTAEFRLICQNSAAAGYNEPTSVELLSNLVWLAIAISLWGLWLWRRRGPREGSLCPHVGLQVIALAMLTAILLPPISITDDLHSCQLPAEIRRTVMRGDQPFAPVAPPSILPFALTLMAFYLVSLCPRKATLLTLEESDTRQMRGHLVSQWSRPPPTPAV